MISRLWSVPAFPPPQLAIWGVKVLNPAQTFAQIDCDGYGSIDFDEFRDWAMNANLDLEDDDENPEQ